MKLYYMPGACPLATHIVLEWAGADYDSKKIEHGELKSPEFLAINPMGAVPALEVEGEILTQNAGILSYISGKYPEARLEGDGSLMSKAQVHRWLGFVNSDIHPAFKPMFGAVAYLGDEALIAKSHDNAREKLRGMFEIADQQLEGRDWIAGVRSLADAYLYVLITWTDEAGVDMSGLDNIARFRAQMEADPAVQRARAAEGLG